MKWKSLPTLGLAALTAIALLSAGPASGQILFDAQLTGFAETPTPIDSPFFGSCVGVLNGLTGPAPDPSFSIACDHNVPDPIAAHIHFAPVGVTGDIVFPFDDPEDIDAVWDDITVDEAIRLLAGGAYVNVHTLAHPGGEIRGQLQPRAGSALGVETVTFALTGDEEVPPVDTELSGLCVAMIELEGAVIEQGTMDLFCTHDIPDPTLAHVHEGAPGVAGPPVITLDPTSPIVAEDLVLDADLALALRNGDLYVNVHTAENPNGEIRGQIAGCFSSPTVLCLGNRYAVTVEWATEQGGGGSGDGFAVPETIDTGMFWFFDPSNLELMIKVLDACAVNGRTWVFFSGLTNVGFDLRVTDTQTDETLTYENPDQTTTIPRLDTAGFDNCAPPPP